MDGESGKLREHQQGSQRKRDWNEVDKLLMPTYPASPARRAHTAHTKQFSSSLPGASAMGLLTAYALESRVGWAPARKERTNERQLDDLHSLTHQVQIQVQV